MVTVSLVYVLAQSLQSCLTLHNPTDHSLPGSSVHGILQVRILKWRISHALLQGIFPTQGLKLCVLRLLHCRRIFFYCWASGEVHTHTHTHTHIWKLPMDFIFLGSKITADGDCSHEIKRRLLLGRKVMTNYIAIFKSRDIALPTKVCLVEAMVFPVVMYGCESWTVKKAECWRIDGFELWCWRRLLRVPWSARRSNQSILKEISPGSDLLDEKLIQ